MKLVDFVAGGCPTLRHLTWAVQPHPKTIKESDKDYLKPSQLPSLALGEVGKFKDAHGFYGLVQSLESSNDSRAGDIKVVQNWGNVQIVGCTFRGQFSCVELPSAMLTWCGLSLRGKDRDSFVVHQPHRKTTHPTGLLDGEWIVYPYGGWRETRTGIPREQEGRGRHFTG